MTLPKEYGIKLKLGIPPINTNTYDLRFNGQFIGNYETYDQAFDDALEHSRYQELPSNEQKYTFG